MNMCALKVLCECFAHVYVHTHMYDDKVNRGALGSCDEEYPNSIDAYSCYIYVKCFLKRYRLIELFLIYNLWAKQMGSENPKAYAL